MRIRQFEDEEVGFKRDEFIYPEKDPYIVSYEAPYIVNADNTQDNETFEVVVNSKEDADEFADRAKEYGWKKIKKTRVLDMPNKPDPKSESIHNRFFDDNGDIIDRWNNDGEIINEVGEDDETECAVNKKKRPIRTKDRVKENNENNGNMNNGNNNNSNTNNNNPVNELKNVLGRLDKVYDYISKKDKSGNLSKELNGIIDTIEKITISLK